MEHTHQIEQAVVVTLLARRYGRIPQIFDESLRMRVRGGQRCDGGGGNHPGRVAVRDWLAVEGVLIGESG